jgi:hypothetical protein
VLSSLWRSLQQNKEPWSFQDPAVAIIVYLWQRTDSNHSTQSALRSDSESFLCNGRIMKTAFQETQLPLRHTARKIRHNLLHNARVVRGLVSYTLQSSSHTRGRAVKTVVRASSQSQSHIATDGRSVSQYDLVSSPICDFWSEIFFQSYCLVFLGHPLWREVRSVICQSLSL